MQEYFDFLWKQTEDCLYIFDMRGAEDIRLYQANPAGLGYLKKTGGNPVGEPLPPCLNRQAAKKFREPAAAAWITAASPAALCPYRMNRATACIWMFLLRRSTTINETMIIFWGKDITPSMRLRQQREALLREYDRLFSCRSPESVSFASVRTPLRCSSVPTKPSTGLSLLSKPVRSMAIGTLFFWTIYGRESIVPGKCFLTSTLKTGTLMWISFSFGKTACRSRHSYWS